MKHLLLIGLAASLLVAAELRQHPDSDHKLTHAEALAYCAEEPGWRLPTMIRLHI